MDGTDSALRRLLPRIAGLVSSLFLGLLLGVPSVAQIPSSGQLRVEESKSLVLTFPEKVSTVSVANPEIAQVVAITTSEIVVIGKQTGVTTLAVWGESQRHQVVEIRVVRSVTNQQVLLEVQVGVVDRSSLRDLGADFTWTGTSVIEGGTLRGGSFSAGVGSPAYTVAPNSSSNLLFRFIGTSNQVTALVRALEERGDLKLLATPKLLALSGQRASFLSGGEIPVPLTSGGASQSVSVDWREYGVKLEFKPTIVDSTLINLEIAPEVSSLDWANAVTVSGFSVPAVLTRKANTTIELRSGEAILLGGLIAEDEQVIRRRLPVIGQVPLLGLLFSRRQTVRRQNELVFVVSPRIIGAARSETVPQMPWSGLPKGSTGGP